MYYKQLHPSWCIKNNSIAVDVSHYCYNFVITFPEAYSKIYQVSKLELFTKIVNSWKTLNIFAKKKSILDAWQGSKYTSGFWRRINIVAALFYTLVLSPLGS